jgi:hypothetical protein
MDSHARDDRDTLAARRTNVLSHLDGTLDEQMLHAMQGVWSMLEHAAADAPAHARAVRARLFWESLTPGGPAAAPVAVEPAVVTDLVASWDASEEEADERLDEAAAEAA